MALTFLKQKFNSLQNHSRWVVFRSYKRSYFSLWILIILFVMSFFSEWISNSKPYVVYYEGNFFFPIIKRYSQTNFGELYHTEPDYLELTQKWKKNKSSHWMIFPPLVGPLFSDLSLEGNPPYPPSSRHWFGTDELGRDVLSRLLYGFRICMIFSLSLTFFVIFFAVFIGGLQGYLGGRWDFVLRHFIEIWSAIPLLYVVILLGSFWERSLILILGTLVLFSWVGLSYYLRSEFLKLKSMSFVKASKLMNFSSFHIFYRHILPNALTPVITFFPFLMISGIGSLTALDFLGFGLNPPNPSWGEMIQQGLRHLYAPWISISVISSLLFTLLLVAFIGEGIREAFDSKNQ